MKKEQFLYSIMNRRSVLIKAAAGVLFLIFTLSSGFAAYKRFTGVAFQTYSGSETEYKNIFDDAAFWIAGTNPVSGDVVIVGADVSIPIVYALPVGVTAVVLSDVTLSLPAAFTNNGDILVYGEISSSSTVTNNGTITNNGRISTTGGLTNNGSINTTNGTIAGSVSGIPPIGYYPNTYEWIGPAGGVWDTGANWRRLSDNSAGVPVINGSVESVILLTENVTAGVLTFNNSDAQKITIYLNGNTLTATNIYLVDSNTGSNSSNVTVKGSGSIYTGMFDSSNDISHVFSLTDSAKLYITQTLYGNLDGLNTLTFSATDSSCEIYVPASGVNINYGNSSVNYVNFEPKPYGVPSIYKASINSVTLPSTVTVIKPSGGNPVPFNYRYEILGTGSSYTINGLSGITTDGTGSITVAGALTTDTFTVASTGVEDPGEGVILTIRTPDDKLDLATFRFIKEEIIWDGSAGTAWNDLANWTGISVLSELETADVVIPSGLTNFPVIAGNETVKSITILNNANLTVTGSLTVTTLTAEGLGSIDASAGTVIFEGYSSYSSGNSSSSVFGSVAIAPNAVFTPSSAMTLKGDLSVGTNAEFDAQTHSASVFFTPVTSSAINANGTASTKFDGLNCENMGGKTLTLNGSMSASSLKLSGTSNASRLTVQGNSGTLVLPGDQFGSMYLDIQSTVPFISGGFSVTSTNSVLTGTPTGWALGGTEAVWLGITSNWNTASNWSTNAVPGIGATVIIPGSGTGAWPKLTAATDLGAGTITVQSGASLDLAGFALTVSTLDVQGKLRLTGTENFAGITALTRGSQTITEYYGTGTTAAWEGKTASAFTNLTILAGSSITQSVNISIAGNFTNSGTFAQGGTISFNGNFTNNGTFTPNAQAVTFAPASVSIIGGTQPVTFSSLLCTGQAGKTLSINSAVSINNTTGSDFVVSGTANTSAGRLNINGTGSITLSANQTGSQFLSVESVAVSNAGVYSITVSNSISSAPPAGWSGLTSTGTFTWDGNSGTDFFWGTNNNWVGNLAPPSDGSAIVVIPNAGVTGYPTLDGTVDVSSLTIESAASLTLAGNTLSVQTVWVNDGTVYSTGSGSISLNGTVSENGVWSFSGGTIPVISGLTYKNMSVTGIVAGPVSQITIPGNLTILSGTLTTAAKLIVQGTAVIDGSVSLGADLSASSIDINTGGSLTTNGNTIAALSSWVNDGTVYSNGAGSVSIPSVSAGVWEYSAGTVHTGITFGSLVINGTAASPGSAFSTAALTVTAGTFTLTNDVEVTGTLTNNGTIAIGNSDYILSFSAYAEGGSSSITAGSGTITSTNGTVLQTVSRVTFTSGSTATINGAAGGLAIASPAYNGTGLVTTGTVTIPGGTLGSVTITSGTLSLGGDVTVQGNWSNTAGAAALTHNNNTVIFDPPALGTIVISGDTNFYNVTCSNEGGQTLTIDGAIAVSNNLALSGTGAGNLLTINGSGSIDLTNSQINGSYLSVGEDIDITTGIFTTVYSSAIGTAPAGWNILTGDVVFVWSGNTSTDWDTAGNWETGIVPSTGGTRTVEIPDLSPVTDRYPSLASAIDLESLTIAANASVTLNGQSVTCGTSFTNNGIVYSIGTEILGLSGVTAGVWEYTGGTIHTGLTFSELRINGTVASPGTAFSTALITVEAGADFTLDNNVTATNTLTNNGNINVQGNVLSINNYDDASTGSVTIGNSGQLTSVNSASETVNNITFNGASSTINGGAGLTLGVTAYNGTGLTTTGTVSLPTGTVASLNVQGTTTVSGNLTLTGDLTVTGTIDADPGTLTFNGTGVQQVNPGTHTIQNMVVDKTSGSINFITNPLTVTTLSQTTTDAFTLTFNQNLTVTNTVTFNTSGTLTFGDADTDVFIFAGGVSHTEGGPAYTRNTTLNGTLQTSNEAVTVDNLTLGSNAEIDSGTALTSIMGTTTGNSHNLTITGDAAFNGAVTGTGTLEVTGTTDINTTTITTTGNQTYHGNVTLGADASLTADNAGTAQTVTFNGNVTGVAYSLTINDNAVFGDAAGDTLNGVTALTVGGNADFTGSVTGTASIEVTGTTDINTTTITTTGTQTYSGNVTLGAAAVLTANNTGVSQNISMGANLDGGGFTLSLNGNFALTNGTPLVTDIPSLTFTGADAQSFDTGGAEFASVTFETTDTVTVSTVLETSGLVTIDGSTVSLTAGGTLGSVSIVSGTLSLGAGITVEGNWSNTAGAAALIHSNNTVAYDPPAAGTSIISGSTNFYDLTCSNEGGQTLQIDGSIGVSNTLTLSGTGAGNLLTVNGSGNINLSTSQINGSYLSVGEDIDITTGIFTTVYSSAIGTAPAGWNILTGDVVFVWSGNTSTDWDTAGNWETGIVPSTGGTRTVEIPDLSPVTDRYPSLASAIDLESLTIAANASVTLNGQSVTCGTSFTNNGIVYSIGTEILGLSGVTAGVWEYTGGTIHTGLTFSELRINGTVASPGTAFSTALITVEAGADFTLDNNVTATNTLTNNGNINVQGNVLSINNYDDASTGSVTIGNSGQLTSVNSASETVNNITFNGASSTINGGAGLTLGVTAYNGTGLTTTGTVSLPTGTVASLNVQGTTTVSGNLTLTGDLTVTGTIDADPGTLTFNGTGVQQVNPGTHTIQNMVVDKTSGSINFITNPLTVTTLSQTTTDAFTLTFNQNLTVTNTVTFNTSGTLTFGDADTDVFIFAGGVSHTEGGPAYTRNTTLNGTLQTSNEAVTVDNLTLGSNAEIDSGTALTSIMGTTTGNSHNLTITGDAAFNGAVTGTGTLEVTGTTDINTTTITTTGNQTYHGNVTLGADASLTADNAGTAQTVTFNGNVTGVAYSLTINDNAVFGDAAGDTLNGVTALTVGGNADFTGSVTGTASIEVTGTTDINTTTITTTGTQTYSGNVTLGAAAVLTANNTGVSQNISMGANLDGGGFTLSLNGNFALTNGTPLVTDIPSLTFTGADAQSFDTGGAEFASVTFETTDTVTVSTALETTGLVTIDGSTVSLTLGGTLGSVSIVSGTLSLGAGITVEGNWSNTAGAAALIHSNNTVAYDPPAAGTSIISGSTNFYDLTCSNEGGQTLQIDGSIGVSNVLTLSGTAAGNVLTVNGSGNINLSTSQINGSYLSVGEDIDITTGIFTTVYSSAIGTAPAGWNILTGDVVFVWSGNTSTDWDTAGNWETGIVPSTGGTRTVEIPDLSPVTDRYPSLASAIDLESLTIAANASVTLNGQSVTCGTSFTNNGIVYSIGTEILGLSGVTAGVWEYTGGTIHTGLTFSELRINGTVASPGTAFSTALITVEAGADFTLDNNVTATNTLTNNGNINVQGNVLSINNYDDASTGSVTIGNSGQLTSVNSASETVNNITFNGASSTINGGAGLTLGVTAYNGTGLTTTGTVSLPTGTVASLNVQGTTTVSGNLTLTGDLTVTGTIDADPGTLTFNGTGVQQVNPGTHTIQNMVVDKTGGSITFITNPLTVTTLTQGSANAVGITFNQNLTVTEAVTFNTSGMLTFGDAGTDEFIFNNGVSHTTAAHTRTAAVYGTLRTSDDVITLDNVIIGSDSIIRSLDAAGAAVTVNGTITGGGNDLALISGSGTTTVSGDAAGLGAVTLQSDIVGATGAVSFEGNFEAASITTYGRAYDISFTGDATTVTNAVTFSNTGLLTLGNAVTDSLTFTGGITHTAGSTSIGGALSTVNQPVSFAALTLTSASGISTGAAPGSTISVSGDITGGNNSLSLTGTTITLGGICTAMGNVAVTNSGLFTIADTTGLTHIAAASFEQKGTGPNQLNGSINTSGTGSVSFASDLYLAGALNIGGGSGALACAADLFINAAGSTIIFNSDVEVQENIALFNGIVNMGADCSEIYAHQDLILLNGNTASMYDDSDTGTADVFTYYHVGRSAAAPNNAGNTAPPSLASFPPTMPDTTPINHSGTYASSFALGSLDGKTLRIGQNFYANGITFTAEEASDNLTITLDKDTGNSMTAFAESYNCTFTNVTANYAVAASENCTDNLGNSGIAFSRPELLVNVPTAVRLTDGSGTYTVYDDVIRVEFADSLTGLPIKIENTNNEIRMAVQHIATNNGGFAFTGAYTDPDCTQSTDGQGDLSVFYLRTNGTAAQRWNTDADGTSAGDAESTDRGRTGEQAAHRAVVPNLDIPKLTSTLYASLKDEHKNRIVHYSLGSRFTATADRCSPVLTAVYTGQELHDENPATQSHYDSHNFLEFVYSEPVDIGVLPPDALNERVNATFNNPGEWGGAITSNGSGGLTITGYAEIASGTLETGSRASDNTAIILSDTLVHSLYRVFSLNPLNAPMVQTHRVRISIAGWVDGTVPINTIAHNYWPGFIDTAETPSGIVARLANIFITDRSLAVAGGNELTIDAPLNHPLPVLVVQSDPLDGTLFGPWDVSPPMIAKFLSIGGWEGGSEEITPVEILSVDTDTNTKVDAMEMHFYDNTPAFSNADQYQWVSKRGWYDSINTIDKQPAQDITGGSRDFTNGTTITDDNRTQGGIRASSLYNSLGGFTYRSNSGTETAQKTFQQGVFSQEITITTFFGSTTHAPSTDSLYASFSLLPADQLLFPLRNYFHVTYTPHSVTENTGAFITDLAGNRMKAQDVNTIDRTPPEFSMTVGPVGSRELYIVFTKQMLTTPAALLAIPGALELTDTAGTPIDAAVNSIDTARPAVVRHDTETGTGLIITLINPIRFEDVLNLRIRVAAPAATSPDPITGESTLIPQIFDSKAEQNSMVVGHAHTLSDFAVNAFNVLYAFDNKDMVLGQGAYSLGEWAVRDFSENAGNSGRLQSGKDITIAARINGYDVEPTPLGQVFLYADITPNPNSVSMTYNENTGDTLRIWLPTVFKALSPEANTGAKVLSEHRDPANAALRNYVLPNDPANPLKFGWGNDAVVQMVFAYDVLIDHDADTLTAPVPLYMFRLSDPSDISSLDVWQFTLSDIQTQRGGVTILNNVINVLNKETVSLEVDIKRSGSLTVHVMTLDGNIVKTLQRGRVAQGLYYYKWDGTNMAGNPVARGMYFIRVVGPDIDETRKVMAVKE